MVAAYLCHHAICQNVSVLALSSRFDGHLSGSRELFGSDVSVLALSSRFDGLFLGWGLTFF